MLRLAALVLIAAISFLGAPNTARATSYGEAYAGCLDAINTYVGHAVFYTGCVNYHEVPPYHGGVIRLRGSFGEIAFVYDDPVDKGWSGKTAGPSCNCAGDPITLSTGNEFHDETDSDLGALSLHRYYNSDMGVTSANLGTNWRHSFDRGLDYTTVGGTTATLYRDNGRVVIFRLIGGAWTTDQDVHDTLTQTASGWTYFEAATRQHENYDASGYLTSIVDSNGLVTSMTRSTADTPSSIAPAANLLLTVTDPRGRTLSFAYEAGFYEWSVRLSKVTLPDGGVISYSYADDSATQVSNLSQVTYPDGTSRKYQYTMTQGDVPWPNALTGVVDEKGVLYTEIGYDSEGRATSSRLAGGADATSISYNADGTTSVTYPLGVTTSFSFAVINHDMRTTGVSASCGTACGQPNASATYDDAGNTTSTTDFNGNVRSTTFDTNGLLTKEILATGTSDQRTTDTTWNSTLRLPLVRTVKDHTGKVVSREGWAYNAAGQTTAQCLIDPVVAPSYICASTKTAPSGVRRTVTTYCTAVNTTACPLVGLILKTDGPRTDVTDTLSYAWYPTTVESGCATAGVACHHLGDLKSTTDGAGLVTTYVSYDKAGRVTRVKDPNGVLTDYTYTARGWLATKTLRANSTGAPSNLDATTAIAYDPTGTVHSVTDPDGVTTTYTYDAAHRLTDITDGTGARVHYTLDSAGNRTAEQVFSSAGTVVRSVGRSFNALGQLTAITDGLNRTVFSASYPDSYDANGNLVHSQDGLGVQRKQAFDGLNRLVATIQDYQGSNAATRDAQSVTSYDALDRVTGFSDPDGLNTTYDIDAFGNVTGLHSPDTGTTTRTYDIAGNRITSTDATNVASTSTFDALNRVLTTSYPDSSLNIQYKYDEDDAVTGCTGNYGKGRLTRIIETNGGLAWCYDGRGNVVRKQQTVGTTTTTTTYTWTPGNRLASVTTPNGTLINYSRDVVGHITTVTATTPGGTPTTVVSNVVYTAFEPIASYTLGNGESVTRSYDAAGNLTDIDSAAFSLHMKRDVPGNITAIGDAPGVATPTETYSYDALYRLTGFQGADGSPIESYSYNKTGDRLSKTGPGTLTGNYSYAPGTHHLTGVGTTTREVDARGNTTANVLATGAYGYGYNQRNRLTVVQKDGLPVGAYVLNALGQRVSKIGGGVTTRFDYDEGSHLLGESSGGTARDYVWLDDLPVGVVDYVGSASGVAFIHADGLGSPRVATNASGALLWKWPYASNPFGEKAAVSASGYVFNPRYAGQYFDDESGLNYNFNRDYEAATGRYVQSDPIGLDGGLNTYAYVGSRPTLYSDPIGLCPDGSDWWPSSKKNEPSGEIDPNKGPKCPLPMPNDPLKPVPIPGNPIMGCHAAMLEKILKCNKRCPGVLDRTACIEEWRFREPACVADHAEE